MTALVEPVWGIPPRERPGTLPARCDILIVGGGITGLGMLHWLGRRPGVILVERDRIAAGASGRNAGFLLAGVASCYAVAVRRYGRPRAGELWRFTAETHDLLAEALAGRASEYRRGGSFVEAAGDEEAADLEESAQLLREDGFEADFAAGRLSNPRDGCLHPVQALQVLASDSALGTIREGVGVDSIEAGAGGVRVRSGRAECLAGAVVLATNAYTSQVLPEIPISPVRAQMAATGPDRRGLVERPTYAHRGYRYWRQLDDGRVLAGGYRDTAVGEEVGFVAEPTARIQAHLDRHLLDLGAVAPVERRWAGIMGFTDDELPIVGPVAGHPGVFIAAGYNGHGMAFAFHCARRLAEHIEGRRPATGLVP